jgi:hypothetical protein
MMADDDRKKDDGIEESHQDDFEEAFARLTDSELPAVDAAPAADTGAAKGEAFNDHTPAETPDTSAFIDDSLWATPAPVLEADLERDEHPFSDETIVGETVADSDPYAPAAPSATDTEDAARSVTGEQRHTQPMGLASEAASEQWAERADDGHAASEQQAPQDNAPLASVTTEEPIIGGADEPEAPATEQGASTAESLPSTDAAVPPPEAADEQPLDLDLLPLERVPTAERPWLTDFQLFEQETKRLARLGAWKRLAATTGRALIEAPFATRGTRTSMLLDLALLYRDRLRDTKRAEQAFASLVREEPASTEAPRVPIPTLRVATRVGRDLRFARCGGTRDLGRQKIGWIGPAERRSSHASAWGASTWRSRLGERLWKLGDAQEEASRTLARYYRLAGQWAQMADFLREQKEQAKGATQARAAA